MEKMAQLDQKRLAVSSWAAPHRILAIIVLYKTSVEHSVTYASLQTAALAVPAGALDLRILVYDNTPGVLHPSPLPPNTTYVAAGTNGGLAKAYNFALTLSLEQGFDWLLTLDQDTALPSDVLVKYLAKLDEIDGDTSVAVVAPQVIAKGRVVSPNYFIRGAWPRWFEKDYCGIPDCPVYAFNSGSLIQIAALRQIKGYSPWFWLDNSDSLLFKRLNKFGKRVYVAGDIKLNHDFSMLNMSDRVSEERYRNILLSESAFWDLEMNALAGLERTGRLAGRMFNHWRRRDPTSLRRLTWEALCARLLRSREVRIATWRKATMAKLGGVVETSTIQTQPKISVCMAAYNGERFIEAQLRSIFPQLGADDEIVIVDDASQDDTLSRIRALQAELATAESTPRILLSQHETNRGVVPTFEEAIRRATGDILFLCDDDDVWAADKVKKVLKAFAGGPDIQLVCTGLELMDVHGEPMEDAGLLKHRRFSADVFANLWHNQFQGSTMAFRSELLEHILPLPAGRLFLQDAWIGLCNTLAGGGTAYIAEPLLRYRRHSGNYSRRLSRLGQVKLRVQLTAALIKMRFWNAFG